MKKFFASLFFIGAIITIGCSQTPAAQEDESVLGPSIEFQELEHDFGSVEYNGKASTDFVFTNTGTEPLILSNVRTSCGCTTPQWPREPIESGKQGKIQVNYTTTTKVAPFSKSITVYSNAQDAPIVLRIKGKVEPKISAAAN